MIEPTKHASSRMQQRGIPPLVIDWLLDYGAAAPAGEGCTMHYFDKAAWRALERAIGRRPACRMADYRRAYTVTRGSVLVTAGYRRKRIRTP